MNICRVRANCSIEHRLWRDSVVTSGLNTARHERLLSEGVILKSYDRNVSVVGYRRIALVVGYGRRGAVIDNHFLGRFLWH